MIWSKLKKKFQETLSDSLRKRLAFHTTKYSKRCTCCGRLWIEFDHHLIFDTNCVNFHNAANELMHLDNLERDEARIKLNNQDIFSQYDFYKAMENYLNYSIDEAINSKQPAIRALAMLDRRLGKRRLIKMDMTTETNLVKRLFQLRCDVEGLRIDPSLPATDSFSRIDQKFFKNNNDDVSRKKEVAVKKLSVSKSNKIKTLIQKIRSNALSADDTHSDIHKTIIAFFSQCKNQESAAAALIYIDRKSKLINDESYLPGVLALIGDSNRWIRDLEQWHPDSNNSKKQFSSLLRFLLAVYDVPLFMDQSYLSENPVYMEWFRHIGGGKNIRTAEGLPVKLTKNMAHHFLQAPEHYSIEAAIRWAQIKGFGGDRRIADGILGTRLLQNFDHDDFWQSVLTFFIKNPMLDVVHYQPIIDFLWHKKFENRVVFVERGVAREEGPEQPNLTMRGRTVDSLLRDVEDWHRQLGRVTKCGVLQWAKSDIADFEHVEGKAESKNMRIWKITELLSSEELIAEGRALRHCVATYASSCQKGRSTIWSMSSSNHLDSEKILTIEVSSSDKSIVQVRGKANRLPSSKEMSVIRRWADRAQLSIEDYLR